MYNPDKSPLLDTDHDAVLIADALRDSPHISFVAPVEPGDEIVWFRDADGIGFELSLTTVEPVPDAERVAYAWDAVAAAIGNHSHFVRAALEQTPVGPLNLDTITAHTRTGNKFTLKLTGAPRPGHGKEPASPPTSSAADIAYAADRALNSNPTDAERATAELLHHLAATWDRQEPSMRRHARAVAGTLSR
ncbi:hypothetical protein [Streptomyces uncialis]|uniref:hypothetical protein n=1 Tax=Streptomyces uncialis TaxID=1048205 RepID=UPI002F93DE0C|nr:hypothetical protein OG924_37285 [Streptomyces uncialis]